MEIRGAAGQEANIAEGRGWCDSDVLAGSLPLPCDCPDIQGVGCWDAAWHLSFIPQIVLDCPVHASSAGTEVS